MRLLARAAGAAVAATLLVGCGGDSGAEESSATAAVTAEEMAADAVVPGSAEEPFPLGEPAEIGHYAPDDIGASQPISTLEVSVDEVVPATAADLAAGGLQLDEEQQASDVYYVRSTYTNTGPVPVRTPATPGLETGAGRVQALIVVEAGGDYAACAGAPERLRPGATASGCSIVLVPSGEVFSTVSFHTGGDPLFVHWDAGA